MNCERAHDGRACPKKNPKQTVVFHSRKRLKVTKRHQRETDSDSDSATTAFPAYHGDYALNQQAANPAFGFCGAMNSAYGVYKGILIPAF